MEETRKEGDEEEKDEGNSCVGGQALRRRVARHSCCFQLLGGGMYDDQVGLGRSKRLGPNTWWTDMVAGDVAVLIMYCNTSAHVILNNRSFKIVTPDTEMRVLFLSFLKCR